MEPTPQTMKIVRNLVREIEVRVNCTFGEQTWEMIEKHIGDIETRWDRLLQDEQRESALLQQKLDAVRRLSDVGDLFDGADHLNEYTHEENEKHVTAALDRIHRIVTGKEEPE